MSSSRRVARKQQGVIHEAMSNGTNAVKLPDLLRKDE
jgi:hypothetical protein